MSGRPKVLLLAWSFPPVSLIGSVRAWNMSKYLARSGWQVTVVTPCASFWRTTEGHERVNERLAQEGIRRIQTGHAWRSLLPFEMYGPGGRMSALVGKLCHRLVGQLRMDCCMGWTSGVRHACAHLNPEDVDVVLATGPPFVSFRLAKRLSARLGRPYVIDYRDPWSGNAYASQESQPARIRAESRLLSDCAAVTVVSRSWAADLNERFAVGSKVHVVTNGYDPEELSGVTPYWFDHFAIVYTGCFYPPKRTAAPLMAALQKLKSMDRKSAREWRFHYYGIDGCQVREAAAQFGVEDKVVLHGDVPRREALAAVSGAQVAAVVASVGGESSLAERGMVTGKIFEALGLKTPVLVVAPPGSDAESIAETAGLLRCFAGSDAAGMARFLGEGILGHTPPPVAPEVYSWPSIGKKLDQLLRDVAVGRASGVRSAEFQVRRVRSA